MYAIIIIIKYCIMLCEPSYTWLDQTCQCNYTTDSHSIDVKMKMLLFNSFTIINTEWVEYYRTRFMMYTTVSSYVCHVGY